MISGEGEFGKDIPAGDRKTANPFLQCMRSVEATYSIVKLTTTSGLSLNVLLILSSGAHIEFPQG